MLYTNNFLADINDDKTTNYAQNSVNIKACPLIANDPELGYCLVGL